MPEEASEPTLSPSELVLALQRTLQDVDSVQQDANKWRILVGLLRGMGFGPAVSPQNIYAILPDPLRIAEAVTASQEAAPKVRKFRGPNRKATA